MNLQEIYDKVVRHLRNQGRPAYEGNACLYRTESGDMCAAGCLFDPGKLGSGVEGLSFYEVAQVAKFEELYPDLTEVHIVKLISCLQDVHDVEAREPDFDIGNWPPKLRTLAVRFGLSSASVDEAPWFNKFAP